MLKKLFLITITALLLLSCESENSKSKNCEWRTVESASINEDLKKELNTVFSGTNELIEDIQESKLYVINSESEFLTICSDNKISSKIDFNNRCIVFGKLKPTSVSDKILYTRLSQCVPSSIYEYEIIVERCTDCGQTQEELYFWNIYPLKIEEKDILLTSEDLEVDCDWEIIEPITVSESLTRTLNYFISAENRLIENIEVNEAELYIISSESEFYKIYPSPSISSIIDFESQCVVIGKIESATVADNVSRKQLSRCISSGTIKYEVEIERCVDCLPVTGEYYFWEIYPVRMDQQDIVLIINENEVEKLQINTIDAYIAAFDACCDIVYSGETGKACGYYIVTENKSDTLLTYNFPDTVFDFPRECFLGRSEGRIAWFPDKYQESFKIRINYHISLPEERVIALCKADIGTEGSHKTQIMIHSAEKIE